MPPRRSRRGSRPHDNAPTVKMPRPMQADGGSAIGSGVVVVMLKSRWGLHIYRSTIASPEMDEKSSLCAEPQRGSVLPWDAS